MDPSRGIPPPLSQGWGYGVVLGVGLAFAVVMLGITQLLKRYQGEDNSRFETYAVAGRQVGTGLTAAAVISSWAWSTALLSSSVVTYVYGIAGAYWFAAGCVCQIVGFSVLAISAKRRSPHAHTLLEIVRARYGTIAHLVYMVLCLLTNLIATINMSLGSAATISALTGMPTEASVFLLPVGVCAYTVSGGLRATFITDYLHTVVVLLLSIYLCLKAIDAPATGGLDTVWRNVTALAKTAPVAGNHEGSYFTMNSRNALAFGTLHTLGNLGLVIQDSSYWQKSFSASPAAAVDGYTIGGLLYFAIPWALGTIAGLVGLSLTNNPAWPAFGRELTADETNNGLVLAYTALATAGKGGAVAVLFVIFMACTSTISAQLVGVSSIVSSDIFKQYLHPRATERQIINVSRGACVGFALVTSGISVAFFRIGLSLTWTLYFLGVVVCPGVVPTALTLLWRKQSRVAAIAAPLIGLAAGLATWISTAWHYGDGIINVTTTGALIPCMWGNIVSFFVPLILAPLLSVLFPDQSAFEWDRFNDIKLIRDDASLDAPEKEAEGAFTDAQLAFMSRKSRQAAYTSVAIFLATWIVWPFGMWAGFYTFSLPFFRGWVVVSLIWLFVALIYVTFAPPIEGASVIKRIALGVIGRGTLIKGPESGAGRAESLAEKRSPATPDSPSTPVNELAEGPLKQAP